MTATAPFLRKARVEDARAIHEAHMRSIRELCAKDYTPAQIAAWGGRAYNEALRLRSIREHVLWVVESEGEVRGLGELVRRKEAPGVGEILCFYFCPEVTGKGLGKALLARLIEDARSLGLSRVELGSTRTALGFYLSQGFSPTGPESTLKVNGEDIPYVPMAIDL